MSVEIINESDIDIDVVRLSEVGRFVLDQMRIHPLSELSVKLVDAGTMERMHLQFMNEPGPTDVLAFEMDELRPGRDDVEPEVGLLGDVVLCPQVAAEQAQAAGHSMEDELHMLCTHGILHLLGYDHATPEEEREMFGLTADLLASWRAAHP